MPSNEKFETRRFSKKKFRTDHGQKKFLATKRKLVTRRFKSQMRSYLKYNYQIINFNKPFAHGLRSCKNVHYHVNQISKNRKWIILKVRLDSKTYPFLFTFQNEVTVKFRYIEFIYRSKTFHLNIYHRVFSLK